MLGIFYRVSIKIGKLFTFAMRLGLIGPQFGARKFNEEI